MSRSIYGVWRSCTIRVRSIKCKICVSSYSSSAGYCKCDLISSSINSYILENDKKKASDYLTKFSTLIRLILENSDKQKINLDDELAMLKTYLQLEQNRLDNKFDYHIEVDASIKTTAFEIPPLILQPFIENAVWHGVVHKTEMQLHNVLGSWRRFRAS